MRWSGSFFLVRVALGVSLMQLVSQTATAAPVVGTATWGNCSAPSHLAFVLELLNHRAVLHESLPPTPGDRHCPDTFNILPPSAPLRDRSNCPWSLEVEDLGENFIPSVLLSARCRCRHCLPNSLLGCEPVFEDVRVLQVTGCQDNVPTVNVTTRRVARGCTCAQAIVVAADVPSDYAE